jgi:hypothetical protein
MLFDGFIELIGFIFNGKKYLLQELDDKVDLDCLVKIFVIPAWNI